MVSLLCLYMMGLGANFTMVTMISIRTHSGGSPGVHWVNFRAFLVLDFLALNRIVLCGIAENGAQSISFHIAKCFLYQFLKTFAILF